jgi:hypothetical protein
MLTTLKTELAGLFADLLGLDVEAYTSLTTVEDEISFVTKNGGLMSLLCVHGHRRVVGEAELETLTEQLTTLIGSAFSGRYHTLDICFHSDPPATARRIRQMLEPSRRTAERLALDLEDIFAERIRHLPNYTATESVYLVLWTSPYGLPRSVRRQEKREKRRRIASKQLPGGFTRDNQNLYAANGYLRDTHHACVKTLLTDMTTLGFDLEVLPVRRASVELRALLDPDWTLEPWSPVLPGDLPPARQQPNGRFDPSSCWLPALGSQLLPRSPRLIDYRTVQVGDRLYQPLTVDYPQLTEVQPFEQLLDRVRRERLPWRFLIRLEGGASDWLFAKRTILGLLHFAGHWNKLAYQSVTAMRRYIN